MARWTPTCTTMRRANAWSSRCSTTCWERTRRSKVGYVTIWGPRQSGKTWIKGRVLQRLRLEHPAFDVVSLNVEHLQTETDTLAVMRELATEIALALRIEDVGVDRPSRFARLFSPEHLGKPLILLIDEFHALSPDAINAIVGVFRNICISRQEQAVLRTGEKDHLLHGVALVGVRSVLGAESRSGSPFNVQRSLRIPNLTFDEVRDMFAAYQRDSGQAIKPDVVRQLYAETRGQPGLTSWLGETAHGDRRWALEPGSGRLYGRARAGLDALRPRVLGCHQRVAPMLRCCTSLPRCGRSPTGTSCWDC